MFSVKQKREIALSLFEKFLRETKRDEFPEGGIRVTVRVEGAEDWSCEVQNNGAVRSPSVNPCNESKDK